MNTRDESTLHTPQAFVQVRPVVPMSATPESASLQSPPARSSSAESGQERTDTTVDTTLGLLAGDGASSKVEVSIGDGAPSSRREEGRGREGFQRSSARLIHNVGTYTDPPSEETDEASGLTAVGDTKRDVQNRTGREWGDAVRVRERARVAKLQLLAQAGAARRAQANTSIQSVVALVG